MPDQEKIEIPSDAKINASSPGTLAIEQFKVAMAVEHSDDEEQETQKKPH